MQSDRFQIMVRLRLRSIIRVNVIGLRRLRVRVRAGARLGLVLCCVICLRNHSRYPRNPPVRVFHQPGCYTAKYVHANTDSHVYTTRTVAITLRKQTRKEPQQVLSDPLSTCIGVRLSL